MKKQLPPFILFISLALIVQRSYPMEQNDNRSIIHQWQLTKQRNPSEWQNLVQSYIENNNSIPAIDKPVARLACTDGVFNLEPDQLNQIKELFNTQQNFSKKREQFSFNVQEHDISTADVSNLFSCLNDRQHHKILSDEEIARIYYLANYLQINDLSKIDQLLIKRNIEIADQVASVSAKKLPKTRDKCSAIAPRFDKADDSLDLSNLNLTNRDDLSLYDEKKRTSIIGLDLSHNRLKKLNLPNLFKLFPKVKRIWANDNLITSITQPDWDVLIKRKGFILNLNNNQISNVDCYSLKAPEGCKLSVDENFLTDADIEKINHALTPLLIQKYKRALIHGIWLGSLVLVPWFVFIKMSNYIQENCADSYDVKVDSEQLKILNRLSEDEIKSVLKLAHPEVFQFKFDGTDVHLSVPVNKITERLLSIIMSFCGAVSILFVYPLTNCFASNDLIIKHRQFQWPHLTPERLNRIHVQWNKIKEQQKSKGLLGLNSFTESRKQ